MSISRTLSTMAKTPVRSASTRRSTRPVPTTTANSLKREASPLPELSPIRTPKSRRVKHEPVSPLKTPNGTGAKQDLKDITEIKDVKPEVTTSPTTLRDRKMKAHTSYGADGPFPSFTRPTPSESRLAHQILAKLHGPRIRPDTVIAPTLRAGCGDSPSVLDALVRTILSQNTSDTNSSRAKKSMDDAYGSSDNWSAVATGGQAKLEEAIRCGGLSQVKSKVILNILAQAKEKYGVYSLDHLHSAPTEEAMSELLGFDGVGPKTASCVLLFCLGRDDFAVDTHVHRITGLLGWRPKTASREQTYHHLNRRIPDEDKYGLHILLVTHGKRCDECKAGGKNSGKCELRRAFRNEAVKGELGDDLKGEANEEIKEEIKESKEENTEET